MGNDVLAVILNWNSAEDTLRCLRAVRAGEVVPEILVVDNGSTDASLATLSTVEDKVLALPRNLGYAGGMNAGIRVAAERGTGWVWLLNADCVPAPGALATQLGYADRFAVAVPLQVSSAEPDDPDPEPYLVAAMLPNGKVAPFRCPGCPAGAHEVDVVTGTGLLLSVDWATRVGLFDERFFHYKEEFDLVRRIALAGGRAGLVCAARVWHQRGGSLATSSPRAVYYHHRNEVLYVRKHYRRPLLRLLREPVHYKNLAMLTLGLVTGPRQRRLRSLAGLAGYRDGLRGIHGPTERY